MLNIMICYIMTIVIDIIYVRYRHDTVPTNHNSITHQRIAICQEADVEADRKRGEARKGRRWRCPGVFPRKMDLNDLIIIYNWCISV